MKVGPVFLRVTPNMDVELEPIDNYILIIDLGNGTIVPHIFPYHRLSRVKEKIDRVWRKLFPAETMYVKTIEASILLELIIYLDDKCTLS